MMTVVIVCLSLHGYFEYVSIISGVYKQIPCIEAHKLHVIYLNELDIIFIELF